MFTIPKDEETEGKFACQFIMKSLKYLEILLSGSIVDHIV